MMQTIKVTLHNMKKYDYYKIRYILSIMFISDSYYIPHSDDVWHGKITYGIEEKFEREDFTYSFKPCKAVLSLINLEQYPYV